MAARDSGLAQMTKNHNITAATLVQRVWNYAHVLKDDGLAFMDYTEQITYLLFLKMEWEQRQGGTSEIPSRYSWGALKALKDNVNRLKRYHQGLKKPPGGIHGQSDHGGRNGARNARLRSPREISRHGRREVRVLPAPARRSARGIRALRNGGRVRTVQRA